MGVIAGCESDNDKKPADNPAAKVVVDQGEQIVDGTKDLDASKKPAVEKAAEEETPKRDEDTIKEEPKKEIEKDKVSTTSADYYAVAGITNAQEFEDFFYRFQNRVISGDASRIAKYVDYPFTYYQGGFKKTVNTKDAFIEKYDKIFTQKVIDAVKNQTIESAFVRDGGVMIGEGEVWINASIKNDLKYAVTSINN